MNNQSQLLKEALAPKSDQLNADDLITGSIDIVIRKVTVAASGEQRIAFYYHGDNEKPYKPGKSMGRLIMEAWGDEPSKYIGRGLRLYRDPEVKMKGEKVGGVRISHMTDINETLSIALTVKRGAKAPWIVKPLVMKAQQTNQPVQNSRPDDTPAPYDAEAAIKAGKAEAAKGLPALQSWWAAQKGHHGKLGGEPFLNELKAIATPPENPESVSTSAGEEEVPFDV